MNFTFLCCENNNSHNIYIKKTKKRRRNEVWRFILEMGLILYSLFIFLLTDNSIFALAEVLSQWFGGGIKKYDSKPLNASISFFFLWAWVLCNSKINRDCRRIQEENNEKVASLCYCYWNDVTMPSQASITM